MKFKVNNNEVYASTGGRPFDKKKPLIIFEKKTFNNFCSWQWTNPYDMGSSN